MTSQHHRIVIVGSGFSGIGMAVRLLEDGERDFVLLERASELGGTWRDNTYPGCRCDVPSHLYSFSFAPNPNWSSTFSPQPEILEYLRDVAQRFGVTPHVRFEHELRGADWDEGAGHWRLDTSQGELTADVLVAGQGPLSDPQAARRARHRQLRGHDVPLGPLGPRARPRAASAWRWWAPARRRSSSCPRSSPTWRSCTCSSAPRPGSCRTPTGP